MKRVRAKNGPAAVVVAVVIAAVVTAAVVVVVAANAVSIAADRRTIPQIISARGWNSSLALLALEEFAAAGVTRPEAVACVSAS